MIVALSLLLAAQADATTSQNAVDANPLAGMQQATATALRAGVKTCVGATTDPAGQDARLVGWVDATPAQISTMHGNGRMVVRDNVLVIVRPGMDGGCVVMAALAPDFDKTGFYTDLGKDIGVPLKTDPKEPVTDLGKGEVLVTTLTDESTRAVAVLVVGNKNGKHKNKGN